MPTLYVTEPGARIEKEYKRILVMSRDEEVLFSAPLAHVTDVVIVGSVGITTQAMVSLLGAGVSFSIISRAGKLLGRLMPPSEGNIFLRHTQYRRSEAAAFCFDIARAIVLGKLKNERALARRLGRGDPAVPLGGIERITSCIKQAENESDLDRLRGQEGIGAKAYFEIFRAALNEGWSFPKRTRRPPADPANALLSLGRTAPASRGESDWHRRTAHGHSPYREAGSGGDPGGTGGGSAPELKSCDALARPEVPCRLLAS